LTAVGELPKAPIPLCPARNGNTPTPFGQRQVYFKESGGYVTTALYQRDDLHSGDCIVGPAIIEQMDATTVLPPQMPLTVDKYGNMMVDVTGESNDRA